MRKLTLTTAPTAAAVEEQAVRDHLRVDVGDEDYLVGKYIAAATAYLDGWTGILGRALMPQSWTMTLDTFPAGDICIPFGPVTAITSVKYKDDDGTLQTVATSDYRNSLGPTGARIRTISGWPSHGDYLDAVEVVFVAGNGCPEPVEAAIMMMVAGMFEGRQGDAMITPAVAALIAPYRRVSV